jgi:hypothetical protein
MPRIPLTPLVRRTPGKAPPPTPPRPNAVQGPALDVDVAKLASTLRRRLRGEVRFGDGDRALCSTDASHYRQIPIGVVLPRDGDDVVATVSCREQIAQTTGRQAVHIAEVLQMALERDGREQENA